MYNNSSLEKFVDKVHAEAEEAAQIVYDKYEKELRLRIKAQLHPKDKLYCANGAAIIERNGENISNDFTDTIAQLQYPIEISCNFYPDYITTKT